jgi:hypothetical protein
MNIDEKTITNNAQKSQANKSMEVHMVPYFEFHVSCWTKRMWTEESYNFLV